MNLGFDLALSHLHANLGSQILRKIIFEEHPGAPDLRTRQFTSSSQLECCLPIDLEEFRALVDIKCLQICLPWVKPNHAGALTKGAENKRQDDLKKYSALHHCPYLLDFYDEKMSRKSHVASVRFRSVAACSRATLPQKFNPQGGSMATVSIISSRGIHRTSTARYSRSDEFENLLFVFKDNNHALLDYGKCFVAEGSVVWHYTTGEDLLTIWDAEVLIPSRSGLAHDAKPVLWFSPDQDWEPTAQRVRLDSNGKMSMLSKEDTAREYDGLVRLGLPAGSLSTWDEMTKKAEFDDERIQAMKNFASMHGTRTEGWLGCTEQVHIWDLMIEVWDGENWECFQDPSATESRIWIDNMKAAA